MSYIHIYVDLMRKTIMQERKITRRQMVGLLRSIVQDDYLLASTIKNHNDKVKLNFD